MSFSDEIFSGPSREKKEIVPAAKDQMPDSSPLYDSMEILMRMANGIDPFDYERFRCATAMLPHQYAKLSRSVSDTRSWKMGSNVVPIRPAHLQLVEERVEALPPAKKPVGPDAA